MSNDNIQGILISTVAISHIKHIINKEPGAIGLRLSIKKAGCTGYKYVTEVIVAADESDIKMNIDSTLTLYVKKDSFSFLDGVKIDCVKKDLGNKRLVFINPREKSQCGCGESFYV